jgi:hypothetical protein
MTAFYHMGYLGQYRSLITASISTPPTPHTPFLEGLSVLYMNTIPLPHPVFLVKRATHLFSNGPHPPL